jgi:DNA topoisomerase-6 subunit B
VERSADDIFEGFREHSIAEFFKRNKQMLGYSGKVHSMVTVVHEYISNSIDACEEGGILPSIKVYIKQCGEERYIINVVDNGPGIPRKFIGKALATILTGTKFHVYRQQRGQQGIGAAGCTLFSQITTGKSVHAISSTGKDAYECDISIDISGNKPIIKDIKSVSGFDRGLNVSAEFDGIKYENSDKSVFEYLRRTALANPHVEILFASPDGKEYNFPRAVEDIPHVPKPIKPHPLGVSVNDIIDFAHLSQSRKVSVFLAETFARMSDNKIDELRKTVGDAIMDKAPKDIAWDEAQQLIKAFKDVKWIAPDSTAISAIGSAQIRAAIENILNPESLYIVERKPQVLHGGIPFVVEAAISYGGNSGKRIDTEEYVGNVMRFANKVPLLFDAGSCAITEAIKGIQWKRYGIDIENKPVSIFVNVSSVYIPYAGVGKEAISKEEEIIEEIRLGLMDAARGMQKYLSGRQKANVAKTRYKTLMGYSKQLSIDLEHLTNEDRAKIESNLEKLILKHYPKAKEEGMDNADSE